MPVSDRIPRLSAFLVAMAVLVATPLAVVAADAFTDVPDSNVFHEDIAWLAAAGVTKGCNPPANTEFCPSDNVTREQMSAFMRRLAQYMDAEDGTPALADHATTADMLDNRDSAAYTTVVFGDGFTGSVLSPMEEVVAEASTSVATVGYAVLEYSFWVSQDGLGITDVRAWLQLDNDTCDLITFSVPGSYSLQTVAEDGVEPLHASVSASTITQLDPGSHTVSLCVAAAGTYVSDATVTGVFSPTGSGAVVGLTDALASSGPSRSR